MIKRLSDAIILVADDQTDVARTLCQPLHKAGASLRYAADGQAVMADIAARPADLILVDMKMPPEEWGGLWLLRELRKGGWTIPVVVLSGEGSKRQVIEAQRLGAKSWVDKDHAGEELLDQCAALLADSLHQALDLASGHLPTPLAQRFARYARTTDPGKRQSEGLHVLEAVLRFVALLGLSSTPPQPLAGITADRLRTPSMRTWFDLCAALAQIPEAGKYFMRLLSFLVPERAHHQLVHDFISLRNDIAHGRAIPDQVQDQRLDTLLRRFAYRAHSSWRADIAVPRCMTYDGSSYQVEVLKLSGTGMPSPSTTKSQVPIITGELVLLSPDSKAVPLAPWLVAQETDDPGELHCLLFDGVQRTKSNPTADTPFKYSKVYDGNDPGPMPVHSGGNWQAIAPWITQ